MARLMDPQIAFDISPLASPSADGQDADGSSNHDSYWRGYGRRHHLSRTQGRQNTGNIIVTRVVLLSVLSILAVLVCFFRAISAGRQRGHVGRQLAFGEPEEEGDQEQSWIISECLDLQEETGHIHESVAPLPEHDEAIDGILTYIVEYEQGSHPAHADASSSALAPRMQVPPGESVTPHLGGTTQAGYPVAARDDAVWQAFYQLEPGGPGASPMGSPTVSSAEGDRGFSVLCRLLQSMSRDSSSQVSSFQGDQEPAASQGGVSLQVVPAEQEQAGPSRIARRRKKPQVEAESSSSPTTPHKRQKLESPIGKGRPKKHVSGWKGAGRRQAERAPSPPEGVPKPEHDVELTDEDPLLRAVRGVPLEWTPPDLDYPDMDSPSAAAPSIEPSDSPVPSTSQGLSSVGGPPEVQSPPGPSREPRALSPSSMAHPPEAPVPVPPPGAPIALPGPVSPMSQDVHPFYRLPGLAPGTTIRRHFNRDVAFSISPLLCRPLVALKNMRTIFAKPVLDQTDCEMLIIDIEKLVNYLILTQRFPVQGKPVNEAVLALGRRFLFMEAIFCTIAILGPAMHADTWWPEVVNAVPTDVYFDAKIEKDKSLRNARLAARLSAALELLKKGTRPSVEMTISLKRDLLCSKSSVFEFKQKGWEAWRDDDKGWRPTNQ